ICYIFNNLCVFYYITCIFERKYYNLLYLAIFSMITCPVQSCSSLLANEKALGMHIRLLHQDLRDVTCKVCTMQPHFRSIANWRDHHRQFHSAPNHPVANTIQSDDDDDDGSPVPSSPSRSGSPPPAGSASFSSPTATPNAATEQNLLQAVDGLDELMRTMILKRSIGVIEADLDMVVAIIRDSFKIIASTIVEVGIDNAERLFNTIDQTLHAYSNPYQRRKQIRAESSYIPVKELQMGTMIGHRRKEGVRKEQDQPILFYGFPLKETIQNAIKLDQIKDYLVNAVPSVGSYSTLRDGSSFREAEKLLQTGEKLLPVHIYFDDATPASSLGYKSSSYQMAYFHLTVAALPSHLTAGLRFKFPLAIAHSKDISSFNFNPVYNYIVSQFKSLETISMDWQGMTYPMRLCSLRFLATTRECMSSRVSLPVFRLDPFAGKSMSIASKLCA
ncbi:hypothetical protein PFISCL1PPCAC_17071, partial [Pristionchus fissidentatus]